MTITPITPTRALRRPRRIDLRAVFGICLMFIATGGSIAFWSVSSDTRPVIVATHDLPAMAVLETSDLTTAYVRVDDTIYQSAIPASDMTSLVGKALAEPIHANQMLVRAQMSQRPALTAEQMAFTITAAPEIAVGGRLRPGDAVQVLVTFNKGKPDTRTTVVLARTIVYDVGYEQRLAALNTDSSGGASAQGAVKWVTLIVTPEEARQLAQAKWSGDLDIALLPPQG